jgi:hypothetical protein
MNWLRSSHLVIAEVTVPSLGVGYELGIAESLGLPILALHRLEEKRVSAMVTGNPRIQVERYETVEEAGVWIDRFMASMGVQPRVL